MKYTTLLIVALLATPTLAANGCDKGKCMKCITSGADMSCDECYKSKVTAVTGATYKNCSSATLEKCLHNNNAGTCNICDNATHFNTLFVCTAFSATGSATGVIKPTDTNCLFVFAGVAANTGFCAACKGALKPAAENQTPACDTTALTALETVTGCYAHTAATKCLFCTAGTLAVSAAATLDVCTAWTATNKGCTDGNCSTCNQVAGYYMVSTTAPQCSMSSAILSVAGMIVALFLANF